MEIVGHGIDLVEVDFFRRLLREESSRDALARYFTSVELTQVGDGPDSAERLAGRFAVKEAVLKALGVGWAQGIAWTDIEIQNLPSGAPVVHLSAGCRSVAAEQRVTRWLVTISHTPVFAVASAIAISDTGQESQDPVRPCGT